MYKYSAVYLPLYENPVFPPYRVFVTQHSKWSENIFKIEYFILFTRISNADFSL